MSDDNALWALAIHEAMTNADDEAPTEMHTLGFSRTDRWDGKPQPGWVDGPTHLLAQALRAAGWSLPEGVVERLRAESDRWPDEASLPRWRPA